MASLFIGHAAQKSKLHNLQYDEGGNHMAETETELQGLVGLMLFNASFNNITVIWWRYVLLVEETRGLGENHRPVASH